MLPAGPDLAPPSYMSKRLVRLTDGGNSQDAAALREYLESYGIRCVVRGEHHAALLGFMGPAILGLDILVPEDQLEEAVELTRAFQGEWYGQVDDQPELLEEDEPAVATPALSSRKAVLLGVVPGFGMAHFYAGASVRGCLLLALQALAVYWLWSVPAFAVCLIGLSMMVDIGGATVLVGERNATPARKVLPAARVHQLGEGDYSSAAQRDSAHCDMSSVQSSCVVNEVNSASG